MIEDTQGPDERNTRPEGADDGTVEAAGKVSEALEWIVRARGRLYDFHQMIGRADFLLEDAADLLGDAGHSKLADMVRQDIIGRNVLEGRWTYQVVEEFDRLYFDAVSDAERTVRDELLDGRTHVLEAELKEKRRSKDRRGHEARP
jgi:hypothetical protein